MTEKNGDIFERFTGEQPKAAMPPGLREELEARARALAAEDPVCPECKARMVLRIAQGAGGGGKFWGCRNYPKCRCTIKIEAAE